MMNDFIIIILIFLGAIVMSLSIMETKKLILFIKQNQYKKRWNQLFFLMIFFLFGYVFVILLLVFKIYTVILFLTGIIFLFGSIFVFLVVKTGLLTIQDLVKSNQHLIKINAIKFKLEKEKETAEVIAKTKNQFLANISHELKTPMNGIMGMTDLLSNTDLNTEQHEFLTIIKESADNLLLIINDILDFSEIESGKLTLNKGEFDLKKCLDTVLDLMLPQVKKKGLKIDYEIQSNIPLFIKNDDYRLLQILLNLVKNAIKFTSKGEVFISVKTLENNQLMFSVKDTGIGISQEHLNLLFQPFSQVDSSSTRKFGGTGLGLAICKELTHLMGGNIWVESELGKGSTFFFTIRI